MSLRLVTGPANAAKAAHVLGAFRERLADEPFLVVPAFRDVEHAQREAAERGAVLGARVVRFAWLFDEIAQRCADDLPRTRRASDLQRELIVHEAVAAAPLQALAASAERPGFARAATRLIGELERSLITPQRFARALTEWAGDGPRSRFARELGAIYLGYRSRMDDAGLASEELTAWRAADALRHNPERWGDTPVFVYGFDDFTELELDAIESLARRANAEVTVSLPYERGRTAFKALSAEFQRLADLAVDHVEVEATDEFYVPESRAALHHLERNLFEPGDTGATADPGDAVRLLAAGGDRAEVELIAAEVLDLLRGGVQPGQVAIVFRDPAAYGSIVEQVFDAYGIPFSIDRRVALEHTTLGRALLALLRCAMDTGTADDLLAWLRAPGYLRNTEMADGLEAELRKRGARDAVAARRLWEDMHEWTLDEIDRLGDAAGRGPEALLAELDKRLEVLFARPYRRQAHVFQGAERDDPRVWNEAHAAIGQLRHALGVAPSLDAQAVHDALAALPVRMGDDPRPERVQVASPEQVRARRFQAVIVAGLQEGELPRGAAPEPFLSDDDRRELAIATGMRLPVRDDQLDRERYLFYVCASRAERVLMLSSRLSDEEGNPQVGSFFLQDVAELFDHLPRRVRSLGDVAWRLDDAPTADEWRRAVAATGPRVDQSAPDGLADAAVLEALAERELSTSAFEAYSDCPVKWLVERVLKPDQLEPDPEYMVRGNYAHEVLELTFARLGSRVTPDNLPLAEELLRTAMRETADQFQISPQETRVRAAVRRLEFDLLRFLRRESESHGRFEPARLEMQFGGGDELGRLPPLEIGGVTIQGKIDRVDTLDGKAVVRDYKSGTKTWPVARWEQDRRLQVALYMIAVRELLDLDPVGGFYVPLAGHGRKGVPRGVVEAGWDDAVDPARFDKDVLDREEIDAQLESAREQVVALAGEMKSGSIRPCPGTCSFRADAGCTYPSICRVEK